MLGTQLLSMTSNLSTTTVASVVVTMYTFIALVPPSTSTADEQTVVQKFASKHFEL
jgi:hypothetical protein